MAPRRGLFPVLLVLLGVLAMTVRSAYLPELTDKKMQQLSRKSNALFYTKRFGPQFKTDVDVQHYLKLFGTDMMIWRCKNAIQPMWDWKPIPIVELYCEVIGALSAVNWYKNGARIEMDDRIRQVATPHYSNTVYFSRWINFRLKISNATMADSGIYTFQVTSLQGTKQEQMIYVDISEKKQPKKNLHKKKRKKKGPRTKQLKLKRHMRKKGRKWDYFSYRRYHNNHVYIEPKRRRY